MWRQIKKRVDFKGKNVLDLGCGYGDFMHFSLLSGASFVTGVDSDIEVAHGAVERLIDFGYPLGEKFMMSNQDIDDIVYENNGDLSGNDIIMCFSCLPYLKDPRGALSWMRDNSSIALIECQYKDDGPGFKFIKNDEDMVEFLRKNGWNKIARMGRTHARIRDSYRTIWACYQ